MDTTSTVPATPTLTGPPRVSTRGRLSPATPLPLPTTLLAVMDTTSTVPATPTLTGPPRESTRGRLSPATPLPLPTTPLVVMDTTSTVPATPTPTGPPRVSTRGHLRLVPLPSVVPLFWVLALLVPTSLSTVASTTETA